MDSVRERLRVLDKEDLVALVLELSKLVVSLENRHANAHAAATAAAGAGASAPARSPSAIASTSLTQQQRAATAGATAGTTAAGEAAAGSPTRLRVAPTTSALDALAASVAVPTSNNGSGGAAEEVFAKYQVDEDAKQRFFEAKRLRNNPNARQRVLDMFVQRIGSTQGRSVLALVRGGESPLVNNSKIFVQCVREVEARYGPL